MRRRKWRWNVRPVGKDRERRGDPANTDKLRLERDVAALNAMPEFSANAISEKTCISYENTIKSVVDQIIALPKVDPQRPPRQPGVEFSFLYDSNDVS